MKRDPKDSRNRILEKILVRMSKEEKYPPSCPHCGNTLFTVKIQDENIMDYDFDEERYIEGKPERIYICFYCGEDVTDVVFDFLTSGSEATGET